MKQDSKLYKNFARETSTGYLVNWAARLFARSLEQRFGASSGPMPVFFALQNGRALSQKELARLASVEQPTMAATLKRMERDGLIERRPVPADRRSATISLTATGEAQARTAFQAAIDVNRLVGECLGEADEALFHAMLARVIAALGQDGAAEK
ncbi:MAG: hypothetical protein ABS76_31065 [Pelagibacterium sp. SCN 64-44]|nr:MAG: hypothetical protein ABS76_31065 [Pelagibacterium sp. SCN 64-44]